MYKISYALLVFVIGLVFLGPLFYTVDPTYFNKTTILLSPSLEHIMGTDRLGRDIFARILIGGQVSLTIGFLSALIGTLIGVMYGISAVFIRGNFDRIFIVVVDLFLTFPTLFLLLTLVSYVNASMWVLILIIAFTGWMGTARMVRSESFAIANKPFIRILKVGGVHPLKIMVKYYAPLLAPIVFISFTFSVGGAILAESGLSFLGLGITPPQMSWGSILSTGKEVMDIAWWVSFFPGLMIFIIIFALMNISDGLQKQLNKKQIQSI